MGSIYNAFMQLYTLGKYAKLLEKWNEDNYEKDGIDIVAAGDPAQDGHKRVNKTNIPQELLLGETKIDTNDFCKYIVDGYSMSPEDIDNGDILLCKPLSDFTTEDITSNHYVIINVDKEYYKAKNKSLKFKTKLRKTKMIVPAGMAFDDLVVSLKDIDDSILLSENQKRLKKKFNETKSFYKDRELILSITYRDGSLRYSFHPKELITSIAQYVAKCDEEGNWTIKEL
mgnify:CR=1 FL=1